MKKINEKKKTHRKAWYIYVATFVIIGILGYQLISLYASLSDSREREYALEKELAEAKDAQKELAEYEAYTQSDEYVKNTARNKLGLVGENEIVFKEK